MNTCFSDSSCIVDNGLQPKSLMAPWYGAPGLSFSSSAPHAHRRLTPHPPHRPTTLHRSAPSRSRRRCPLNLRDADPKGERSFGDGRDWGEGVELANSNSQDSDELTGLVKMFWLWSYGCCICIKPMRKWRKPIFDIPSRGIGHVYPGKKHTTFFLRAAIIRHLGLLGWMHGRCKKPI